MAGKKAKRRIGAERTTDRQTDRDTCGQHASYTPSATCYHSYIEFANVCMYVSVHLAYNPFSLPHLTILKHRMYRWCCRMKTCTKHIQKQLNYKSFSFQFPLPALIYSILLWLSLNSFILLVIVSHHP